MTRFIPSRIVRLVFFALSAGCAGLISAEATALTLCALAIVAACCRHPLRLELVVAGLAAFAARHSGGTIQGFQATCFAALPLFIALGAMYFMVRRIFGPRDHRCSGCERKRDRHL